MAAGATYEPIATVTAAGGSATQLVMSSIPATYTDLVLVVSSSTSTNTNLYLRFNNDSTSLYSDTVLNGNGTTASSARDVTQTKGWIDSDAYSQNNFNYNAIVQIMNYSNSTTFKTYLSRSNNAGIGVTASVGLYRNTSAINRVDIFSNAGTFNSGSTFTLYGIAAA
jgi:hypothetical protein